MNVSYNFLICFTLATVLLFLKEFDRLNIQDKNHFMYHIVGTGVADGKSVRTRPAKGNIHTCINFISFRISE